MVSGSNPSQLLGKFQDVPDWLKWDLGLRIIRTSTIHMCGIWAYLTLCRKQDLDTERLYKLFMNLKRRGPDRSTFIDNESYLLGFHRLAIMDPSTQGDQPFAQSQLYENEEGELILKTVYVMANGEIYNYAQLKRQVEYKQQYQFKSHSDVEVLLPIFKQKGVQQLISSLEGEFAFTIFQTTHNTVTKHTEYNMYLGRDRFGVRPLYYTINGNTVAAASEMKGLMGIGQKILMFPPRTWMHFRGVRNGELQIVQKQYYTIGIPMILQDEPMQLIRDQFRESVRSRMHSDRQIGCLLSGGLDSSLIAAISAEYLRKQHKKLKTFTIGMANSPDVKYAQKVADHIGSIHTVVQIPEQEWLKSIDTIIRVTETFDITTVRASTGLYLLTKWIAENTDVKVLLTGEGSDELCGGYLYFHNAPNPKEFNEECIRLLNDMHFYDCLRADRGIAQNGLEARVPFLDHHFVDLYLSMDASLRMPQIEQVNGFKIHVQKWLLRKAFSTTRLLPQQVLWRKKQAFSDGVSSEDKSWYTIIRESLEDKISEDDLEKAKQTYSGFVTPHTKEALYYHQIYDKYYPNQNHMIPYYWLPKWSGDAKDPSARTLKVYKEVEQQTNK